MIRWLRTLHALVTLARSFRSALASGPPPRAGAPAVGELLERAAAARSGGRSDEARALFEEALRAHPGGGEPLAIVHYELARLEAERGRTAVAVAHFKSALRADRGFVPAAVALGDAQEHTGDLREAVRTWERAAEARPTLALLGRLERVYRNEGRPSRMIALYRGAAERAPDDLSLAVGLGRVYFELEMLDEAADQFEKIEVRAPEMPIVHAFLGDLRAAGRDARGLRGVPAGPAPGRRVRLAVPVRGVRRRRCRVGGPLSPLPPRERPPARRSPRPPGVSVNAWATAALDLLYPALCPVCDRALDAGRRDPLCRECFAAVERIEPPFCARCGMPWPSFQRGAPPRPALCHACMAAPPRCRRAWASSGARTSSPGLP